MTNVLMTFKRLYIQGIYMVEIKNVACLVLC